MRQLQLSPRNLLRALESEKPCVRTALKKSQLLAHATKAATFDPRARRWFPREIIVCSGPECGTRTKGLVTLHTRPRARSSLSGRVSPKRGTSESATGPRRRRHCQPPPSPTLLPLYKRVRYYTYAREADVSLLCLILFVSFPHARDARMPLCCLRSFF